jgi:alanyl-tRNA synthetase
MEQLGAIIDKCKETNELYEQLLGTMQNHILERPTTEKIGGVVFVHEYIPGFDTTRLREIIRKLKLEKPSALLLFIPGAKCNLMFRTDQLAHEAKEYLVSIMKQLGGKGGGSKEVYTGGLTNVEDPKAIYEKLVNAIACKLRNS